MPHTLDTLSLLPAVLGLPESVEATPETFTVVTSPEDTDRPWAGSFSTALRARKEHELGPWTLLTSDSESRLRQELASYAHLADNWDGDGAKAPLQEAVNDALIFLDGRPADIPLPYPEEGTGGDVGVYWDNSDAKVFAEVTFEGDGTCAYFAVHGVPGAVNDKCGCDNVDVAAPWPDDMLRILRIQDPA